MDFLDLDMIRTEIKGGESRNWKYTIEIWNEFTKKLKEEGSGFSAAAECCSRLSLRLERGTKGKTQGFYEGKG